MKENRTLLAEFRRKSVLFSLACLALVCSLAAQNPSPATPPASSAPSFDVATIKPHEGIVSVSGLIKRPDGLKIAASSLSDMIVSAYSVRSEDQVSGGPGWLTSDRYDIEAKLSSEDAAEFQKLGQEEMKTRRAQMLRALLEDRFKLQVHLITKDVPIYELVVAKGGPKLQDAATDTDEHVRKGPDGKPITGVMLYFNDHLTAEGYSVGSLANMLSQPFSGLGRPVIDKTDLTGAYNFTLNWSPQMKSVLPGAVATADAPADDAPSIFTAIEELGLKLQPATGPEKIVMVDHVERPSEN